MLAGSLGVFAAVVLGLVAIIGQFSLHKVEEGEDVGMLLSPR